MILAAFSILIAVFFLVTSFIAAGYRIRSAVQEQAQRSLSELFLFTPLRELVCLWLFFWLVVVSGVLIISQNIWVTAIVAVICAVAPVLWLKYLKQKRARNFYLQLPDALLLLSTSLRTGSALLTSLQLLAREMNAPLAQEFTLLTRRIRLGQSMAEALDELLGRLPSVDLERVVIALKLAQSTGGQQAELLEQLSVTMRSKQQLQQRVMALTSQGRLQGKVMTGLPLLMAAALWFIEKPAVEALALHPLGWISTAGMLTLLGLGYWIINKLVRVEVPL